MRIPIITFDKLWHIGELDHNQKYNKGSSQEGNLFSMSRCPAAWRQIVKLGGYPLHEGDQGYALLDLDVIMHPKSRTARQLNTSILRWAQQQDLLLPVEVLRASYFDCEFDEMVDQLFPLERVEETEDEQYETVVQETILTATQQLKAIHHLRDNSLEQAVDFAIIEWARAHAGRQLDGVYWHDRLDPYSYRAPRAGMFEAKVESLRRMAYFPEDEETLVQGGRARWMSLDITNELSP